MQLEKSFIPFCLCSSQTHLFSALHKCFSQSRLQQDNPILSCGELKTQDLFHRIFLHPILTITFKIFTWNSVFIFILTKCQPINLNPSFHPMCHIGSAMNWAFLPILSCIEGKRVKIIAYYFLNIDVLESEVFIPCLLSHTVGKSASNIAHTSHSIRHKLILFGVQT